MWKSKIVVLSKELRRRLRNSDKRHSTAELLEIIEKFLQKMSDSGYDPKTREEVVRSAVRKHHRDLQTARNLGGSIYQTREELDKKKQLSKLINRPWYR